MSDPRPDACPTVLRLHEAADGYLARIRMPGGRLNGAALHALAAGAALGNDIVELTSRASLQLRGLRSDAANQLGAILSPAGLLPSATHDHARNIVATPLGGRARHAYAPTDGLVTQLDEQLCVDPLLAKLSGRFLFTIDDGTHTVDGLDADVELNATTDGSFRLGLAGLDTDLVAPADAAVATALRAAREFVRLRTTQWRVRELSGGAEALAHALGLTLTPRPSHRKPRHALGRTQQRDGRMALCTLPPLARLNAKTLTTLADLHADIRLSPWRTLNVVDVDANASEALLEVLTDCGLVATSDSGWSGLSACAGEGACARALADVRAAASARASARSADAPLEHWSGCERCCGEPRDAAIRIVAHPTQISISRGAQVDNVSDPRAALILLNESNVPA